MTFWDLLGIVSSSFQVGLKIRAMYFYVESYGWLWSINFKKKTLKGLNFCSGQRGIYSREALRPAGDFVEPKSRNSQRSPQETSGPVRPAGRI